MDLERQAFADWHGAIGLQKDAASAQVRDVSALLLPGGAFEGRTHSRKNGAARRAAIVGHGLGGE
jgi:hypothetical protein